MPYFKPKTIKIVRKTPKSWEKIPGHSTHKDGTGTLTLSFNPWEGWGDKSYTPKAPKCLICDGSQKKQCRC